MPETKPFVLLREVADPTRAPSAVLRSTRVVRPAHVRSQTHRWFRRVERDLWPAAPVEFPPPQAAAAQATVPPAAGRSTPEKPI